MTARRRPRQLLELVLLPILLYLVAFMVLTYPLITRFNVDLYCDRTDGLQNVWNLWWVNKAVTQLHCSPWFTRHLHFPHGTTLVGHTLNPFNGFLAIPLLRFISLEQAYNTVFLFSFVMTGVTAFWLAFAWSRSVPGSLLAGGIFTFSSYHFAHAAGHLQLVALEWIPLFLLAWDRMLCRPSFASGILAGLALFLVILCDYYYFAFSLVAAFVLAAFRPLAGWRPRATDIGAGLAGFGLASACTSGILLAALLRAASGDGLAGAHRAQDFSLDLLALVVPGRWWRFSALTEPYWSRLKTNANEASTHVGLVVSAMLAYTWGIRRRAGTRDITPWFVLFVVFFALALGPVLHMAGKKGRGVPGPYALAELLVPALRLGGCPVRMAVMCVLSAAVVCAVGVPELFRRRPWVGSAALLVMLLEFLPAPLITSRVAFPPWVERLSQRTGQAALMDRTTNAALSLYYQTHHEKPMAEGYIARIPVAVTNQDAMMVRLYERGAYRALCRKFGVGYFLIPAQASLSGAGRSPEVVYEDADVKLIAVGGCAGWPPTRAPVVAPASGEVTSTPWTILELFPGGFSRPSALTDPLRERGRRLHRRAAPAPHPTTVG